MRRSSIGSPYVRAISGRSPSRFFSMASAACIPETVSVGLKGLCPRACAGLGIPTSPYNLTVRVFSYPATSGAFLVLTTCSIFTGGKQLKHWTESVWLCECRLSHLRDSMKWQAIPDKSRVAQSYLVWTSQKTFAQEVMHRLEHSYDTFRQSQSHDASAG